MKRVLSVWLFQRRPPEDASAGKKTAFWLWNALLLAGTAIALGLVSLALAAGRSYGWEIFRDYFAHPVLVVLNLLPPLVFSALLYGLLGRAWLAYAITALPVLALAFANYYKLAFRDDPVVAADLALVAEAGKMAERYQLFISAALAAVLAAAVLSAVLLALLARGRPHWLGRTITAVAAAMTAAALIPVYASTEIYSQNAAYEHLNRWSATQQHIARGLMYPFLHSVPDAIPHPPEGYSEREAGELLSRYEDAGIPEEKKVNIVGVMLEAFTDFSDFVGIEFRQDVYAGLHALEAESYSGTLLTNIFAGGTVDTERGFLTGDPSGEYDYRGDTSSYVRYLKSQGYQTSGDHPCFQWFYNRENVNSYLGFDSYRFVENFYTQFTDGNVATDDIFFRELTASIFKQMEADAPLFSFSVSYQGHGPYDSDRYWWGGPDKYIFNYELDEGSRNILGNYLGSVFDTQKQLTKMVDAFRARDEPIVLVVFGDHKPWLGDGNSVYTALGVDLSQSTDESIYNYWSTPYLIWANDAAEEVIGHELVGEGPTVSPCFLMDVLFEQLGWTGDAYMQAARVCREELPVVQTSGLYLTADGALIHELDDEQMALVRQLEQLAYYRRHHFQY